MANHKQQEGQRYIIFIAIMLGVIVGFVKIKSFYGARIINFEHQINELMRKQAMAKKLTKEKLSFTSELDKLQEYGPYKIIDKINKYQDRSKITINIIKPVSHQYGRFYKAYATLKDNIDILTFDIGAKGKYYRICKFIKLLEDSGGIIEKLDLSVKKGELTAKITIIFIVRKKAVNKI